MRTKTKSFFEDLFVIFIVGLIIYGVYSFFFSSSENEIKFDEIKSLIEKKIDDTLLDPCSKGVYQQIKNTTNCDFANVLAKLNANDKIYKTKKSLIQKLHYHRIDKHIKKLMKKSTCVVTICDELSKYYQEEFGVNTKTICTGANIPINK